MDHVEPMDISMDSDYEDKENSTLRSNVLSRTPCTEKGYEELDISELNMKLRYSITPASSPMSRSFTANSKDHKYIEDKSISVASDNVCLTGSLNSTLTNNDSYKKVCPLQTLPTDQLNDTNRNVLVRRSLDNGIDHNITITISDNADENFSIPSTSSSIPHTPEATTPTKELQKDGGSPIMRGLRSVLSIFRPSQSPIPPHEQSSHGNASVVQSSTNTDNAQLHPIDVSTPLHKTNRSSPKRNSPLKDSLVFKDDLEKELQWKDESTILFKEEKIPKHKLLLQETVASNLESKLLYKNKAECNKTLEYIDISCNNSILNDKNMTDVETKAISNIDTSALESDSEFVDCETTYNKVEIKSLIETKEKELNSNESIKADQINTAIQNCTYVENDYSLNATAPIESLNTSYSKGEENNGGLNKSMNEEMFYVNNDNNLPYDHSSIIKHNTLTFTEDEDKALSFTEVAISSDLCLSDSKEEEQTSKLKSNETNKTDQINSAIQNSSCVENNYSLNDTVSLGSLNLFHTIGEHSSVNKEMFNVNNDNNLPYDDSLIIKHNTLTFTEDEDKALSFAEVAISPDLCLLDSKEDKQTSKLKSNETNKTDQINSTTQNSSCVENNYSLNDTVPLGSLNTFHSKGEQNNSVLNRSVNKEMFNVNNDTNLPYDSSCVIKNDTLTFTEDEDKSLSLDVVVKSEGNENIDTDIINDDIVIDSLLKNTFTSTEFDTKLVDKDLDPKYYDNTSKHFSNIVINTLLPENNIDIHNNILSHCIIDKKGSEEIKVYPTSDDTNVEVNNTTAISVIIEKRESKEIKEIPMLNDNKVDMNITAEQSVNIVKTEPEEIEDISTLKEKFTEVIHDNVESRESVEIKGITILDNFKVDENITAAKHNDSIGNIQAYNSNSTIEVLKGPDQFDLDPEVLLQIDNQILTTKTIVSNENRNLSLADEDNKIENLNATNLLSNHSNMTYISPEYDQETKDSILFNENLYFRMSIDTEIPELKIQENNIEVNEISQGCQFNFDDNKSCQNYSHLSPSECCQDSISEIRITKRKSSVLENRDCPNDRDEKTDKSNDQNNYIDIIATNLKQFVELPALPSDSEAKEYSIECQIKTDAVHCMSDENSIPKTIVDILNSIPVETDSVEEIDQVGKINNPGFKSIAKNANTELKEDLNIPNIFESNNTFEGKNEANVNNSCVLQNEEANKSGIINQQNSSSIDYMNQEKNQITSNNEQLHSLTIIDDSEVNRHTNVIRKETSIENSSTSNLGSDTKEDLGNIALKEVLNPLESLKNLQTSPPLSLLLNKKGYDINFDNIDDPFATKTKIRQSPTPESPPNVLSSPIQDTDYGKNVIKPKRNTPKNKRKAQQLKKSGNANNNVLNATYINNVDNNNIEKSDIKAEKLKTSTPNADDLPNRESPTFNKFDIEKENQEENAKDSIKTKRVNVSLDFTEPSVKDMTKSVFNCPEIKDINFRSSSDIQKNTLPHSQISVPDLSIETQEGYKNPSQILRTDGIEFIQGEVKHEEKSAPNNSNETFLSRNTDSNITREVNTEDEDTATFIEMEELIEHDNLEGFSQEKHMMELKIPDSAIESEDIDNGELFIDAEAFEFLLNQNKSNIIAESGKESLFLKFDPLFAKRVSSDGIIAALKKVQNKQSTPKKLTKLQFDEALNMAGPSKVETTFDDGSDDTSVQATSKPMMVVNPAVNPIVSPRKVITPKINRQSLTFTSPAMTVIDRLLSLSGNNSVADLNTSLPSRHPSETDVAITQLREMLADKDIHVHNLRSESKELKDRLSSLEAQVKTLETESADRLRKINDLSETLIEKTKMNKSMAIVVEEYERTIASLITQMEQEKKSNSEERIMLIKERDEQTAHLASMEVSFSDLHSKYEKSKQIIYSMKLNEDTYRKSIKQFEESLTKMQNNYELLKQHATSKLNHANQELEKFNRAHEAEILKLNALIKRKELHITSLEETLTQKTKANEELTAICDELINKVG